MKSKLTENQNEAPASASATENNGVREPLRVPPLDKSPDPADLDGPSESSMSKKKSDDNQGEPELSQEEIEEGGEKRGRLSRIRFSKKRDMPGGLWLRCESCSKTIYRKDLDDKVRVCPACSFHFTLPGKQRIAALLDEGTWKESFEEIEALDRLSFVENASYSDKIARAVKRTGQKEAFLVGTGRVEGREIVLGVLDFSFMGGSMGEVVGEKISLAIEIADERNLPIILFTSSGGARMHEGALSLMQMAKTSASLARFNKRGGFSICVMTHPTTGGVTASFASVCDIILAEPGALIGFAGPRVIATTIKQELPPGFQRAEFLIEKGMIDAIVPRSELRRRIASLVDFGAGARDAAKAKRGLI
jgi:acetyl-CoA carboxylase carboxyl transferase subunit beta